MVVAICGFALSIILLTYSSIFCSNLLKIMILTNDGALLFRGMIESAIISSVGFLLCACIEACGPLQPCSFGVV